MTRTRTLLPLLLLTVVGAGCDRSEASAELALPGAAEVEAPAPAPALDPAARGEMLVNMAGCHHCHTPMVLDPALGVPVPDHTRALSGHPEGAPGPAATPGQGDQAVIGPTFTSFRLPFGVVYAANLTPDPETGLGRWTEAEFIATFRSGHHKGTGRVLLPPMPWENLTHAPTEDLQAIFAYLRTLPPRVNHVPAAEVPDAVVAHLTTVVDGAHRGAERTEVQ